jgi:hypothetical protein
MTNQEILDREAQRLALGLKRRSGIRYQLNRWREEQFLAAEKGATREQAIRAWKVLKTLDAPKTYRSWVSRRPPKTSRA